VRSIRSSIKEVPSRNIKRHRKNCNIQNLIKSSENDDEQFIENMISFSLHYNEKKN